MKMIDDEGNIRKVEINTKSDGSGREALIFPIGCGEIEHVPQIGDNRHLTEEQVFELLATAGYKYAEDCLMSMVR